MRWIRNAEIIHHKVSRPVILVVRFVAGSRVVLVPPLGDGVFEVARHGGRILEDGLGLERRWDDDQLLKLEKQRAYSHP